MDRAARGVTTLDWASFVGLASGAAGIAFGVAAFLRNRHADDTEGGKTVGTVLTELGYIKSGVDDIKRKQERQDEQNMQVAARLTAVEASAKQAHKRLDRLEGMETH